MLFFTRIKLVASVLARTRAIARIKWRGQLYGKIRINENSYSHMFYAVLSTAFINPHFAYTRHKDFTSEITSAQLQLYPTSLDFRLLLTILQQYADDTNF